MANKYFAQLDENNVVIKTVVVADGSAANEAKGEAFLRNLYNEPNAVWKQYDKYTFENESMNGGTPFRGNGAAVDSSWDEDNQVFWKKQPYPSWTKDMSNYSWQPPVDFPSNLEGRRLLWNEDLQRWEAQSGEDFFYWNPDNSEWVDI